MNLSTLQVERAELRRTMQTSTSNTVHGVLRSLEMSGAITAREAAAYVRGLSIPGLRSHTWDELVSRFGLTCDVERSRYAFALPVERNLSNPAQ